MNREILDFFRGKQDYVSGQDLACKLKLSRQGLWKHIQELRRLGYDIAAVPHLGYKLVQTPDRLYPWEIESRVNAWSLNEKIFYYDSLDSTMDKAWKLGEDGYPEGTLVCAEEQTRGRGRLGRSWVSPKYKGLYFSFLLRPNLTPSKISCITLLSAVAVLKGIKKESSLSLSIKWPNDILLEGKKIAGILTEVHAEQDRINFLVVGVGINVNHYEKELLQHSVSMYSYLGRKSDRIGILKNILDEYQSLYTDFKISGPAKVKEEWKKFSHIWGSKVKVSSVNGLIEGQALDLDSDGALLLRNSAGIVEKVIAGDIVNIKE